LRQKHPSTKLNRRFCPQATINRLKTRIAAASAVSDGAIFQLVLLPRTQGVVKEKFMHNISLRAATDVDAAFALHVTEACMRVYAEQTWGRWDGRADLNIASDKIIQLTGSDIGLIGIDCRPDFWFLDKLYLLPAFQRRGIGGYLLRRLIEDAKSAQVGLRLTVLEVNPARRFYERHGFVLTHTISPRHYMEWRGAPSRASIRPHPAFGRT
jgi:GNAT superfamily N-acetyltransferase